MKPSQPSDDANRESDPLAGYADGDPGSVHAARPPEPSDAEWEVVRRRVHARLNRTTDPEFAPPRRRTGLWFAVAATVCAAAAAVVWAVLVPTAPQPEPDTRDVATTKPGPTERPVAPAPHVAQEDPLGDLAVLPIADTDEVVLHRVPGDGWLPVGVHPLPGALALATSDDVELEDPNLTWPSVTPAPGYAPMIFATKPR